MPSRAINGLRAEIKNALLSATTCSAETVTTLQRLLHGQPKSLKGVQEEKNSKSTNVARSSATGKKRTTKVTNGEPIHSGDVDICEEWDECPSTNEKYLLATEVVNITLQTLTDAAKRSLSRATDSPHDDAAGALPVSKLGLGLSSLSSRALQETSPNTKSSPSVEKKENRVAAGRLSENEFWKCGIVAAADCGRLAFEYLRNNAPKKNTNKTSEWQLENGILAFVGRLLALNLHEMAAKELKALQKRLLNAMARPKTLELSLTGGKPDVVISTRGTERIALASLLYFEHVDMQGPALQMVINYQLLVLKLIAASRRPEIMEAAVDYLEFSYECSPGNLILRNLKLADSADWAARQLEMFAQTLLSTCPSLSAANDSAACDRATYPMPEVCVQVQTLAFEARTIWMKIADHRGDSDLEIVRPFAKCVAAFSRRSHLSSSVKYSLAVKIIGKLQTRLMDNKKAINSAASQPGAATLDLYSQLSQLAERASQYSEARRWWDRVIAEDTKLSASSQAKICALYSRLAALNLRDKLNGTECSKVESSILQAVKLLDGDLHGEADNLHNVLREAVELRNAAFEFLRKPAADVVYGDPGIKHASRLVLTSFVRLLIRYLGSNSLDARDAQAILKWKDRVKTVNQLSKSSFDSIISSCNSAEISEPDSWIILDAALQTCVSLSRKLDVNTVKSAQGQDESAKDDKQSIYVRISSSYWTFHTKLKVEPLCEIETVDSLRRSCDVLRDRSICEKEAGSLSWKLSRLGRWQQCREDYEGAKQSYLDSVKAAIDIGTLNEAVHAAASSTPSTLAQDDGRVGVLFKAVKAVVELHIRYNASISISPLFSIEESIGAAERGLLLEWQLTVASLCVNSSQTAVTARRLTATISQLLLNTYDEDIYPLRRRRATISFLRLVADDAGSVDPATVKLAEECALKADSKHLGADGALVKYQDHFRASLNVSLAFRTSSSNLDRLKAALSIWGRIIETCVSCSDIWNQIGDLETWLSQLRSMCEYFHMQGVQSLHVSALQLILKVYELQGASSNPRQISTMIELGLLYLHLGYSGKAGLYLVKAQDRIKDNEDLENYNLPCHLAFTKYLLALGNIAKWYAPNTMVR